MTKFEYIQLREIIEQRNFRKNSVLNTINAACIVIVFAFIAIGATYAIIGAKSITEYTLPATIMLIINQLFSIAKSSPKKLLAKLQEDFEAGNEIDLDEYNGIPKEEK